MTFKHKYKITLSRLDSYTHGEISDTSAAWDRVLSIVVDDVVNLQDEELSSLVYDIISDLSTSAKEDVIELMKEPHIGTMFVLEY